MVKQAVGVRCGVPVQLTIGVATQRDAHTDTPTGRSSAYAAASVAAKVDPVLDAPKLITEHRAWWVEFWSKSAVSLGGPAGRWAALEEFYYTMMYLTRSSMRTGKVAPGLWGPFCITDFSGWSDQM
jgi:hypothetical protein